MERKQCGDSDLWLPAIGIGAWSFGGGDYWGPQDQKSVDHIVHAALDSGCDYFDTAELYNDGESEASLGKALKGRRAEATIGTKVSPHHAEPGALRRSCEESIRRLSTEYIDVYMLHYAINRPAVRHFTDDESALDNLPAIEDTLEEMTRLKDEGKIRHIGISNFGVGQMEEALAIGSPIVVNQLPYNLLCRAIEPEILPFCTRKGIGIIGYTSLMQGLLTGKYESRRDIPPGRMRTRHFSGNRPGSRHGEEGFEDETFAAIDGIKSLAKKSGNTMTRLALAWSASNPGITCTLVGARSGSQLAENLSVAEGALSEELTSELNRITAQVLNSLGPNPDYFEPSGNGRMY